MARELTIADLESRGVRFVSAHEVFEMRCRHEEERRARQPRPMTENFLDLIATKPMPGIKKRT